jgi:two-component system sensor histidine kinase DegS
MSNVVLKAEICEKLIDVDLEKARAELNNLKKAVRNSLMDVRRIIYDLKPMSLEDLGLIPTLQKYVEKFSSESGIDVKFYCMGKDKAINDKNINLTIFRVVQESLNNIRKHSYTKTADVRVEFTPKNIVVRISDKGKGFDTNLLKVEKDDDSGGFGIFSMKERIELLNGTMEVNSKLGKGTVIKVILPYTEG